MISKLVSPNKENLAKAGELLRAGQLVVFPTETVYGLGANALDASAVRSIYEAKGRPSSNPVIVHVSSSESAKEFVRSWPAIAQALADRFWPGPITLVLEKAACIPDAVTAGGNTVGLRVPAHPVALALLQSAKVPLAAPSANPSNQLSPTRALQVLVSMGKAVSMILDGGPCKVGLESTVLDLTTDPPTLLRPGGISKTQIETVIGPIAQKEFSGTGIHRSPGELPVHYSPRIPMQLTDAPSDRLVKELAGTGKKVGWLLQRPTHSNDSNVLVRQMGTSADSYARELFSTLFELERIVDEIVVESPTGNGDWSAVLDRLHRGSRK